MSDDAVVVGDTVIVAPWVMKLLEIKAAEWDCTVEQAAIKMVSDHLQATMKVKGKR